MAGAFQFWAGFATIVDRLIGMRNRLFFVKRVYDVRTFPIISTCYFFLFPDSQALPKAGLET